MMDISPYSDLIGLIVGLGIGIPLIVQFVSGISNKIAVNEANAINAASLGLQAGTSDSTQIAKKATS